MHAIDTNVVVRYLTGDHPVQSARARTLVDGTDVWVSLTVVLETVWVLRSVYETSAPRCIAALRGFGGLPRVTIENPAAVARALAWAEGGMEIEDALHLAQASGCEGFMSFDRALVRAAKAVGAIKVQVP
jgi:predicted nucleic acid-binding protein